MRVFESLRVSKPSLKEKLDKEDERVGFEVVTLDGRTGPLASTIVSSSESHRWPTVGKYRVDVASFESLALPELQVREDTDLFVIDEVGKMELFSSSFFPAVLKVLESNITTCWLPFRFQNLAVIYLQDAFVEFARLKNHPGATIFTLSQSNREAIRENVSSQLVDVLSKH
ncbi:hypothetical protein Pint_28711 [Pistacia integerrima]|uniref:Uncharacterized protein n=1 Tax=Pistacia integerrima TaxID=434235 RepID=A0ACC0YW75_9ROSI|nr:hypothetical protein Pint_28711 [Pistacia integerrima]